MLQHLSVIGLLLSGAVSAQPVYKCTTPSGETTYANTPCPATATEKRVETRGDPPAHSALGLPKDAPPSTRLAAASALFESIVIDGRTCDWALKVTKDHSKCNPFIAQVKSARFDRARETITELLEDAAFANANTAALDKAVRDLQEILKHMMLAAERM